MSEQKITWTKDELKEFDKLIEKVGSSHQVTRISARFDMDAFVKLHGREKCDAMWAHLEGGVK